MSTDKKEIKVISRRDFLRLTGIAGAAVIITSCAPKAAGTEQPAGAAGTQPAGGEQVSRTLIIVAPATPPSVDLDVYAGNEYGFFCCNLYDPPFTYKKIATDTPGVFKCDVGGKGDSSIDGALYESWEMKEDQQTYVLKLRKGVKSPYGNEFTADDVLWRVERAFGTQGSGMFNHTIAGITGPQDVKKIDDYTVEIATPKGPNPLFYKSLCIFTTGFFDSKEAKKHATDADPWAMDWLAMHDAGFGAYHIETFTPGEEVVLVKNPNYYREVYFDRIVWKAVPEPTTRLALLEAGDAHFADSFLTYEQNKQIQGGKGEAILRTVTPDNQENFLELNVTMKPFNNVKARQALAYAVPYKEIIDSAYFGLAGEYGWFVPPFYPDATNEYWVYDTDLEKAKALWEESGEANEFTLSWDSGITDHEKIAILIQTNLAKIGVNVTLDKQPNAVFSDRLNKGTMPAFIMWKASWSPDPSHQCYVNWHSKSNFNFKGYANPKVDGLLEETRNMLDSPERSAKHKEIQKILCEDMPSINVCYRGWHQGANKNLWGLTWYLDSYPRFFELSFKEA